MRQVRAVPEGNADCERETSGFAGCDEGGFCVKTHVKSNTSSTQKETLMRTSLLFIIALALMSCSDKGVSPLEIDFNILMKYGVGRRNELNTFQNTYTKDLVLDGTLTVPLVLSESDLNAIEAKLEQIDFSAIQKTCLLSQTAQY